MVAPMRVSNMTTRGELLFPGAPNAGKNVVKCAGESSVSSYPRDYCTVGYRLTAAILPRFGDEFGGRHLVPSV